ncbi:MAG: GntR family transcriptional regulator [Angelakisella sp.]
MVWTFDSDRPIYLQVMEHLKLGIISGELPPGSRLPAVRDLAVDASVNPNTMQKALSELEREGLLYTQRTNGRFVTEDSELIAALRFRLAKNKLIDFVHQMERLGYTQLQLAEMLTKVLEEEDSNGE